MSDREKERQRFREVRDKMLGEERLHTSIGTLSEKTTHMILKNYYEPDVDKQEIPIGNYVADIFTGQEIIEIQSAGFGKMREKLESFLPEYPVTIVHPIAHIKKLIWIDEETGALSAPHKSPKKGNVYDAFLELYRIRDYLEDRHLTVKLLLMELEEYKLLNGYGKNKKIRASKYDRIPMDIIEEIVIERPEDLMQFVPLELEEPFTKKQFAKAARINDRMASLAIKLYQYYGMMEHTGKDGRSYLYEIRERKG